MQRLKALWANHQRFLLVCGGALLAFLVANALISGLVAGAESTYLRCRRLRQRIDTLHRDLQRTYWPAVRRAEVWSEHETKLAAELGLEPDRDLSGDRSLLIALNQRVDRIWSEAQEEANRRGMVLPEKLTASDFGAEADHGPGEYAVFHSYLDVVEQALGALVRSGLRRIGRPELIPEIPTVVRLDGAAVGLCLHRGVAFPVVGPYPAFIRLLEASQEPGAFLQVRIAGDLHRAAAEDSLLRAEIEFYGFRVSPRTPNGNGNGGIPGLGDDAGTGGPATSGGRRR